MYRAMLRVSWREGVPSTVEAELEIAATVWVQLCAWVWVCGWMCVCVCVWVCVGMHVHLHSFIDGGDSCLLSHHLYCQYSMHQPTLHMHSVTAHSSSPPSSISPCSEVQHGSFSTWPVCTGVLWATLVRPLSVTAVPSTCDRVSTVMSGLYSSPTH